MIDLVGSIDNAWAAGDNLRFFHLIFFNDKIVEVDLMKNPDLSEEIGNLINFGKAKSIDEKGQKKIDIGANSRDDEKKLVEVLQKNGMEIVKGLLEDPVNGDGIRIFQNSEINKVNLSQGSSDSPPSLQFSAKEGSPLRYILMHNVYDDYGKLDLVTFIKYKVVLKSAFGEKLEIKN